MTAPRRRSRSGSPASSTLQSGEVFRAWTVPAELAQWYGPAQFDTPENTIRIDLRVGGRYELTMVRRDTGEEMRERLQDRRAARTGAPRAAIGPDARLRDARAGRSPASSCTDPGDGRTRMELIDAPQPPQARDGVAAGYASAFRKLEALLAA